MANPCANHVLRYPSDNCRQRWNILLENSKHGIVSMDFIIVPAIKCKLFYCLAALGRGEFEIINLHKVEQLTGDRDLVTDRDGGQV